MQMITGIHLGALFLAAFLNASGKDNCDSSRATIRNYASHDIDNEKWNTPSFLTGIVAPVVGPAVVNVFAIGHKIDTVTYLDSVQRGSACFMKGYKSRIRLERTKNVTKYGLLGSFLSLFFYGTVIIIIGTCLGINGGMGAWTLE